MASVDGITVAKAAQIEGERIVSAGVVGGDLILTKANNDTINAGPVDDTAAAHALLTAAHGATGAVMGTTNAQTASNKTFVEPTIASFVNAQHDHGDADDGGALVIGRVDTPAPVTSLTSVNLSDADASGNVAKTLATITCPAGRWLIIAQCEGVTLPNTTLTRFSYDLKTPSTPTLFIAKPIAASAQTVAIDGGRGIMGWLENAANAIINFTITKNSANGALVTTSTQGQLLAVRMG